MPWRRQAPKFQYSRWDGTQVGFDLDADSLLEEMTDDLLYHGDLNAAMRRMMQQGFRDREGRDVDGLRDMLEQLRERRREQLDRYDLGGVYEDIANLLDEIVDEERAGIDRRVDEAQQSGDKRREELLDELAQQRREQLEQLPPDLAGRVSDLQEYDWMDDNARQHFEELMEELKKQLLDSMFKQLNECMSQMSPEQLARMKDMMAELNHMLEQREAGEEPDFEGFMERFGDFFPDNPQTLDELLENMARSISCRPARSCSKRLKRSPSARCPMRRMPFGVSSMRPSRCSMRPAASSSLARFASCWSERAASSPRRSRTLSRSTSASVPGLVALRRRFSRASMSPSWSSRPLIPSSGSGSSPRKRMP